MEQRNGVYRDFDGEGHWFVNLLIWAVVIGIALGFAWGVINFLRSL